MTTIIDGKAIADRLLAEIKKAVDHRTGRKPGLTAILVGDHPASASYVRTKQLSAEKVGIHSNLIHLPESIQEEELIQHIQQLNENEEVDGILVQTPLPLHINTQTITLHIDPTKDVDGFHPLNMGKLLIGDQDGYLPCTPYGIKKMLHLSNIPISGQHVVILGRSNIVGKPLAAMLMQKSSDCNATVTVAHSHTRHLSEICAEADILIAAIGRPHFVTSHMVKEGAVVVDVGINRVPAPELPKGYRIVGDVDFDNVKHKCTAITPVPGGVGPMTVTMLLYNTLVSFLRRNGDPFSQLFQP